MHLTLPSFPGHSRSEVRCPSWQAWGQWSFPDHLTPGACPQMCSFQSTHAQVQPSSRKPSLTAPFLSASPGPLCSSWTLSEEPACLELPGSWIPLPWGLPCSPWLLFVLLPLTASGTLPVGLKAAAPPWILNAGHSPQISLSGTQSPHPASGSGSSDL